MRTSYSAIDTYLQCPQKYKFQEIDRIKTPKSREAIFGTLVHNTLKFMFSRNPLFPTLDEVINHFRENWPAKEILSDVTGRDIASVGSRGENKLKFTFSSLPTVKTLWSAEEERAYFEDGVRMLKKFYEKNAPWNFTVLDLETRFEVPLEDKNGAVHILAGKIDRIDKLPDESYEIIDYKTAKKMPAQSALDKDLQLSLYSLGLQKRWPHLKPEDIKLSLYFLRHGEKLSAKITPEATTQTKNALLATVTEIEKKLKAEKDFEPIPGPLCDWCGYKPICPAWKHLYRKNDQLQMTNDKANALLKEYFGIKKEAQQNEKRLAELQLQLKSYMDTEGLTRLFNEEGILNKKIQQRYEYDWQKIKDILSPLGKWEEVLRADESKLRRVLTEIPEDLRVSVENTRAVSKEYTVLTASFKKIAGSDQKK